MLEKRLEELTLQVDQLMRDGVPVAARADGSPVVTADSGPASQAIRLVLSELRREVPYDSCSVQELRDTKLVIIGGVGFADLDVILGEAFDIASIDIPNGQVVFQRRVLNVRDTDRYRAFRRGLHVGAGIRSWLGAPLIHDDRLFGILALDKAEADYYTPAHEKTILMFAEIVARALGHSREDQQQTYA